MNQLSMLLFGAIFGAGLALSGMTRPANVLAFLDVGGRWDPALLFVIGGAVLVHATLARLVRRRARPIFDDKFHLPSERKIDPKLVVGAALFGVGWGLAGLCPGPAFASLTSSALTASVWLAAATLGVLLAHVVHDPRASTG
jgi:uncharacterized protein